MNDEEMQKLWQSQRVPEAGARDMAALMDSTREQQRKFRRTIFWRDVREVGVGIVLLPIWCWLGVHHHEGWVWYLMIPALFFVMGCILRSRRQQRSDEARPGESVAESLRAAMQEVETQIRLLRRVHWWYLLPILGVLVLIDFDRLARGQMSLPGFARNVAVTLVIGVVLWWVNQYAVRKSLIPRRDELRGTLEEIAE